MHKARIPRKFDFAADTFSFANELFWEYRADAATGKMSFCRREPKPAYAHRCFVVARTARQFLFHARFDAAAAIAGEAEYRRLIREVIRRSPSQPGAVESQVVIPGYRNLREFSAAREKLLKSECGGAWRSYVLRSHWRMVFPVTREYQLRTAAGLMERLAEGFSPIIHLVNFPSLTINHGMVVFGGVETPQGFEFLAYDPNDPSRPARLGFAHSTRTFSLPANHYWAGGNLNIIEIYRSWLM